MTRVTLSALIEQRHRTIQIATQAVRKSKYGRSSKHSDVLLAMARSELEAKQLKKEIFSEIGELDEPAFEILLRLYIAASEGRKVRAADVCADVVMPPTIVGRYLSILEDLGLVTQLHAGYEFSRTDVKITELGTEKLNDFYVCRLTSNDLV